MTSSVSPLEKELLDLCGRSRDGYIVARHFGFDGKGGANFRVIGDEAGLTRERVRQIVLEATTRKDYKTTPPLALDRAIDFISSMLPALASDIEKALVAERLTSRPFGVEGIVNAAALLEKSLPFCIRVWRGERFVVSADFLPFSGLLREVRHRVRRMGMAPVSDFVFANLSTEAAGREKHLLEALLATEKRFRWLDKPSGWFWFSEISGNVALRRIRKMLCVTNPLRVEDLRAGLSKMGVAVPPDEALMAFCRQAPGIEVKGNQIRARSVLNPNKVLNQTERDIYRILSEYGGSMSKTDLIFRAQSLHIKRPTFYQCVSHSPIVARYRTHYSLIGALAGPAGPRLGGVSSTVASQPCPSIRSH